MINGGKRDASIGRPAKLGDMEPARPSSHGMAQCIGPTPTRTFLIILSGLMRMTTAIGRSSTTISSTAYSFRMGRLTSEMPIVARMEVTVIPNNTIPAPTSITGPANKEPR